MSCEQNKTKVYFYMMNKNTITYNGKDYEIKEPTIETWQKLMAIKDWTDENEFNISLIAALSDLTEEQIKKASWDDIVEASQILSDYVIQDSKRFYKQFVHDEVVYQFIDLPNLTFGEFVDIDTFLQKPENEKKKEINLLIAMFYREVDKDGKLSEYDASKLEARANSFKRLPVKYVNGASNFFLRLEKILQEGIPPSFLKRVKMGMKATIITMTLPILAIFGVGLILLSNLRTKILLRLGKLQSIH